LFTNYKQLNAEDFFDLVIDAFGNEDRKQTKWLLKKANKLFPKHHLIPYVEGLLAVTAGDEKKGLKFFKKCLAIEPEFALAHANLSLCYQKLPNVARALLHAFLAVKYAKDDEVELLYQQQEMLDMVEKEMPAELSLEQYIEDGIDFEQAHEYMMSNNFEQAIPLFEKVFARDNKSSPALGNLGICYLMMENFVQSRQCLNHALAVDPSYTLAQQTLTQLDNIEQGKESLPKHLFSVNHGQIDRL
jgi:tetratricopeptide (TPR) repeat protein